VISVLLTLALTQGPADFPIRRYALDPARSSIRFEGTSTLHGFGGRARSLGGEAFADPERPAQTGGARLWVDVASMDTEDSRRDSDMREALGAKRFPRVVFRLKELDGELRGWSGRLHAYGTFEVKGVRRGRVFDVAIEPAGEDGFRVQGRTELSLAEHEIEPPSVLFVKVRDKVEVRFDVVFAPAPSASGDVLAAEVRELSLAEERSDVPYLGPLEPADPAPAERGRAWLHGGALYWLLADGTLAVASGGGLTLWDRSGDRFEPPPAAEPAFAELRRELEGVPQSRREEILAVLARAPSSGSATVERREDAYAVELGGSSWLSLREPSGDAPFAQLFGALEGLPRELRERLGELRGIPREAELRVVLPDSNRTGWRIRVGEPSQGTIPAWVAARGRSTKPASSPERPGARNPSGDAR
jgi:polyisoprenoid-binding protein YceI